MSDTKFTKGEWVVQFGDMIFSSDGVNNEQVAIVCDEDSNDAHLIAAAPDMYEMLEAIYITGMMPTGAKLKKLLAKARGE